MFEWAQGTALRAMMNVPGAIHDDWLCGWMHGFVQSRFELQCPLEMLDITLGDGPRPYLETFAARGVAISNATPELIANRERIDKHQKEYDLVTVLSQDHDECLRPIDFENPVRIVDRLLNAALLLKPGGALIWSYLHCFSSNPEHVHSLLEPAAVYQSLVRRKFMHLSDNKFGVGKTAMLMSGDTLFVRQKPILQISDQHERVTRILAGVYRLGAGCRVHYLPDFVPFPSSSETKQTASTSPNGSNTTQATTT